MDLFKKNDSSTMLTYLNTILHAQHKYKLVWSNEFNKAGVPDSSKWNYEKSFVRNEEHQWYQPENAFVKTGYCKKGTKIY